jgi:hypothetical protein
MLIFDLFLRFLTYFYRVCVTILQKYKERIDNSLKLLSIGMARQRLNEDVIPICFQCHLDCSFVVAKQGGKMFCESCAQKIPNTVNYPTLGKTDLVILQSKIN